MTQPVTIVEIADPQNYDRKDWSSDGLLVFSDEWNLRKQQCENFIKAANKVYDRKIHGRQCIVREITNIVAKQFLEEHHIQGSNNLGVVYFGLFFHDELIAVMTLGRHSRQIAQNRIVLDRYCVKYGVQVQGGAGKLFSSCIKWAKLRKYDEIISFSDNRWSKGAMYESLGFSLEKEHRPDYCYVDTKNPTQRIGKQSQKKAATNCPSQMTESQWCDLRGFRILWDRGKRRWVYTLNPSVMSWKEKLSSKCAEQHKNGDFTHSHIRGYFKSQKCQTEIYYGSSYELRCLYLLEQDNSAKLFRRADTFLDRDNRTRNPDIHIEYLDGSVGIIEVKPAVLLKKQKEVQKQIEESQFYTSKNNLKFSVWSEEHSGLKNERAIINWAKRYIAETTGNTDWIKKQAENDKRKAKKHYDTKIATNKITVYCDYCKTEHTPLVLTHNKNIARNGRYICEREGGFIAGSKPKKKKVNPYADEGKKQCTKCGDVKIFKEFGFDKSRPDGYASRCFECRKVM